MTDFLFARPSFAEGVARILDFGNTLNQYNVSPTDEEADEIAMRQDWQAVGRDLRAAVAKIEQELAKSAE